MMLLIASAAVALWGRRNFEALEPEPSGVGKSPGWSSIDGADDLLGRLDAINKGLLERQDNDVARPHR